MGRRRGLLVGIHFLKKTENNFRRGLARKLCGFKFFFPKCVINRTRRKQFDTQIDWIEQEIVHPADGLVHRVEMVGDQILYEATTPFVPKEYDYCLANVADKTGLVGQDAMNSEIVDEVLRVTREGELQLGSLECFLLEDGKPCFFDFNPVSSLHPQAPELLGQDPIEVIADFLVNS